MKYLTTFLFLTLATAACFALEPTLLNDASAIKLQGDIKGVADISAVEKMAGFLVVGSDEATNGKQNIVQLLKPAGAENQYTVQSDIELFRGDDKNGEEMDIEGLASDNNTLYVLGSHSAKRKKTKTNKSYANNRKRFNADEIENESNRDRLYRIAFDADGHATRKDSISLRKLLANDPVLKAFSQIPGKENGVDIEGLASRDGWLYLGFRGPVLRENYVPVMKLPFDQPEKAYERLFVQLNGMGIRSLATVSGGLLIIAGPVGNAPLSHQLYFWNGKDMVPGKDRAENEKGKVTLLAEVPSSQGGNAEGMTVLSEEGNAYDLLIAYDGVNNQDQILQRFKVTK